ncbi:MAG: aldehyde dehydrogenase [Phycisphaeraceae bacterium]|nr:aldehyde dehydrogenase [Phycisphaeraceae bacterium]
MAPVPSLPVLRLGQPYESLDVVEVTDAARGMTLARVGQANSGLIRRDLRRLGAARRAIASVGGQELCRRCGRAAELFMEADLPLAGTMTQSPAEYVASLSSTSGLPHVMCRRNMDKVVSVLSRMDEILRGLTRGLDTTILDRGWGAQDGALIGYTATAEGLGVVLPSNSPGVNSIWLPAVALGIPVVVKPGREEPWTPWRLIQALIAAGCPAEAFGFYPASHDGAAAILEGCGRSILFGDDATTRPYAHDATVQCHGTGRSKILVGPDRIDDWPDLLDLIVGSVADNGGRSCINASCIVVPRHADAIAEALAERLGALGPKPADDPDAPLSAFANPNVAEAIDAAIDRALEDPGARDVTAPHRAGPRRIVRHGLNYLLPTVVRCAQPDHPLANTEFLFPFVSVVEMDMVAAADWIGPTLAATVISDDSDVVDRFVTNPRIDRINLGPVPTTKVAWDQPHEGNLFEFLYQRRAIQREESVA